jgi:dTDP-4-dehydrorhamnose reductase
MKVLVLGASGVIGQHMRLCVPEGVTPVWHRRRADQIHIGCDLTDFEAMDRMLAAVNPDVIVNLAGESSPDVVERRPDLYQRINADVPAELAQWADEHKKRLIQVSTQAVFDGTRPPYRANEFINPLNEYGRQKAAAESEVLAWDCAIVARPTFCLGIRPLQALGRPNPAEDILAGQKRQVDNRWFSASFASEVAAALWQLAQNGSGPRVVNLGYPIRKSRMDVARDLGRSAEPVTHESFTGLAQRAEDTTYSQDDAIHGGSWSDSLAAIQSDWQALLGDDLRQRARHLSIFLGIPVMAALAQLQSGFGALHNAVAADYRAANPKDDDALLEWYRRTEAYIWELTAYHCDERFNYNGLCTGLAGRLSSSGHRRILCLGDGVGDMTASLRAAGIDAVYHDLAGSKTAAFAQFRYWAKTGQCLPVLLSDSWEPKIGTGWDCIIAFDFLEHVTDVTAWAEAIRNGLAPGGLLFSQNAFAFGSGERGSIPMHLERNDRFERDWDPLMSSLGMAQDCSNWYRRAA